MFLPPPSRKKKSKRLRPSPTIGFLIFVLNLSKNLYRVHPLRLSIFLALHYEALMARNIMSNQSDMQDKCCGDCYGIHPIRSQYQDGSPCSPPQKRCVINVASLFQLYGMLYIDNHSVLSSHQTNNHNKNTTPTVPKSGWGSKHMFSRFWKESNLESAFGRLMK